MNKYIWNGINSKNYTGQIDPDWKNRCGARGLKESSLFRPSRFLYTEKKFTRNFLLRNEKKIRIFLIFFTERKNNWKIRLTKFHYWNGIREKFDFICSVYKSLMWSIAIFIPSGRDGDKAIYRTRCIAERSIANVAGIRSSDVAVQKLVRVKNSLTWDILYRSSVGHKPLFGIYFYGGSPFRGNFEEPEDNVTRFHSWPRSFWREFVTLTFFFFVFFFFYNRSHNFLLAST